MIEKIYAPANAGYEMELLAIIIPPDFYREGTTFVTDDSAPLQVGIMNHPAWTVIEPHKHPPETRRIRATNEVLMVKRGSFRLDLYSWDEKLISSRGIREGSIVILCGGGHSLTMCEDTIFVEVKQGPYLGADDKVMFKADPSCV